MDLQNLADHPREPSARPGPTCFAVDDVTPSGEVLATGDCLAAMQEKLARKILASPVRDKKVVAFHTEFSNPLMAAIHLAFSRHLPLMLSPDAIWLSIVQGFSHHINQAPEVFRGRLVTHRGQIGLVTQINKWDENELARAVASFSHQIRKATDPAIHDALVCDFTTTTAEERTASEVAIMDTYSHYFRYTIMMCVCGIPQITLTGSVNDWQRMRERIEIFESFGLEWWMRRLRPILDQFERAAAGRADREFWQGMYKYRPSRNPYHGSMVTGWVGDLFPYLGDGSQRWRNPGFADDGDGKREVAAGAFPSGLSKVDVCLSLVDGFGREVSSRGLHLVAGLFGLQQLDSGLAPVISWCIVDPTPPEKPAGAVDWESMKRQLPARLERPKHS